MIFGIGTDIAAVNRFQRFLDAGNSGIIERLFTPEERFLCAGRKDAASCLAARFAAKEAFLKALGTGLRDGINWQEMEVVHNTLGKPELVLSGRAAELVQTEAVCAIHLSLAHDSGSAIAMVVLESV